MPDIFAPEANKAYSAPTRNYRSAGDGRVSVNNGTDLAYFLALGAVQPAEQPSDPFGQILSPLIDMDYSASWLILGDSTGNDDSDWPYRLLAEKLGPTLPNIRIVYRVWDDTAQDFGAERVIQAGSAGERSLRFPGADYRYFPKAEMTRTSADFDVRIKLSMDNWNPGVQTWVMGQMGAAGNRAWELGIGTTGWGQFYWSPDGTAITLNQQSGAPLGFAAGSTNWLRATLDADNGAGGYTVTFYKSTDGFTWTQMAQTVNTTSGATSIFDSASDTTIGTAGGSNYIINGNVMAVEIRDGIGGPIINAQPIEAAFPRPTPLVSVVGSPTLYVFNGSMPGAGLTYLTDATRMPKMVPPGDAQVVTISCGLNDAGIRMGALYTAWSNWIDAIRARCPTASIGALTQNPTHTITNVEARRNIPYALHGIAQRKGVSIIDTYRAWRRAINAGGDIRALISDGVHPSVGAGVDVSLNEVWRVMSSRISY
jgi:hypothetical protein